MPPNPTFDPRFVAALRRVPPHVGYGEAWRSLERVAARIAVPKPSYPTVRRFLRDERRRARRRRAEVDRVVTDVLAGKAPRIVP